MKNLFTALLLFFFATIIITSCTKTDLNNPAATAQNLSAKKVNPDVPNCGTGYHWDYYLKKCDANCPSGYHNDSITGACVANEPTGPNRICGEDYDEFGLWGLTISEAVDSLGKWHNDFSNKNII